MWEEKKLEDFTDLFPKYHYDLLETAKILTSENNST